MVMLMLVCLRGGRCKIEMVIETAGSTLTPVVLCYVAILILVFRVRSDRQQTG
jgi:branched-subunit amino acid permease